MKVGGLGDVVGALSRKLAAAGHDVRILLPCYGSIDLAVWNPKKTASFEARSSEGPEQVTILEVGLPEGVRGYLVKCDRYFSGQDVYAGDDCSRFYVFCRAALEWLLSSEWQPEIVHCHDWHSALLPMWLKMGAHPYATVFTIHNLHQQGGFNEDFLWKAGLQDDWRLTPSGSPFLPFNFIGRGILWSDMLTTVSAVYAEEILTPEGGAGMDALLRYRRLSLKGILNGLDTAEYEPSRDRHLPAKYDRHSIDRRVLDKAALQQAAGLPKEPGFMLAAMVGRLDEQKGLDLLERSLDGLMRFNLHLIVVGRGRPWYEEIVRGLGMRFPGRAVGRVGFENEFSHLVYGGADIFLMPSLYEPCGLGQMIAMRYGAIPVVRYTGGLAETVTDTGLDLHKGNGFTFKDYTPEAFVGAVARANDVWRHKAAWRSLMLRAMAIDFSWETAVPYYLEVYKRAQAGGVYA